MYKDDFKTLRYIVILFAAVLISAPEANAIDVRMTADKLSLHANKEPLQDILQHMANLGEIKVRIDPQLNPKITCSFENRDIRQALDSILKPFGHALIWETAEGPAGPILKLVEIQVFKQGKRDSMKPLEGNLTTRELPNSRLSRPQTSGGSAPFE